MAFLRALPRLVAHVAVAGCVVAVGASGFVACGGAELSPLEESPLSTGEDAGSTTSAHDSGSAPIVVDAGTKDSGSSTPVKDASAPPVVDAGQAVDSAPPPPADPGIACGKKTCDPASEVCCVTTNGGGFGGGGGNGNETYQCTSASDCENNGGLSLPCVKPADCVLAGSPAGTVCCVTTQLGSDQASSVACVQASACADPTTQAWMCDQSDPVCPSGDTCQTSTTTIPPYSICE